MGSTPQYYQEFPVAATVHRTFEQCASKYATRIALKYQDQTLSYQQLNEQSNKLAHFLISQNIDTQSLLIISMDRSLEMIISILATIKIGCAYVPVDPNSPLDRIKFIIKDTQSPILLTQSNWRHQFKNFQNLTILEVDGIWNTDQSYSINNLDIDCQPDDLAYCIYTSGSTGKPKGVLVEHRSLINLIKAEQKYFNHPVKNFLFAYSFAFDGSVLLIFKTLLEGATLVIAEDGLEKDIQKIAQLIQSESISHLLTFPSLYNILLENVSPDLLLTLESVSVAGEACPGSLVELHHNTIPQSKFFNQYGPTEATVGATIYQTSPDHQKSKTPIGAPIENVFIHLLNENLEIVDTGVPERFVLVEMV